MPRPHLHLSLLKPSDGLSSESTRFLIQGILLLIQMKVLSAQGQDKMAEGGLAGGAGGSSRQLRRSRAELSLAACNEHSGELRARECTKQTCDSCCAASSPGGSSGRFAESSCSSNKHNQQTPNTDNASNAVTLQFFFGFFFPLAAV